MYTELIMSCVCLFTAQDAVHMMLASACGPGIAHSLPWPWLTFISLSWLSGGNLFDLVIVNTLTVLNNVPGYVGMLSAMCKLGFRFQSAWSMAESVLSKPILRRFTLTHASLHLPKVEIHVNYAWDGVNLMCMVVWWLKWTTIVNIAMNNLMYNFILGSLQKRLDHNMGPQGTPQQPQTLSRTLSSKCAQTKQQERDQTSTKKSRAYISCMPSLAANTPTAVA